MRLPKSFNDITISQFQTCYFLLGKSPGIDEWIKVISTLAGKTYNDIESLPVWYVKKLIYQLEFLTRPNLNTKLKKYLYLNGTVYKAIYEGHKLSAAQGMDLKTFLHPPKDVPLNDHIVEVAHKLLASIYIPMKNFRFKYSGIDHQKISNDFLSARMGDVYGTLFFYSIVSPKLTETILDFGKEQTKILAKHMEEVKAWHLQNTGAGK
jgi:hypothetical protein